MNILLRNYVVYHFEVGYVADVRRPTPGGEMELIGTQHTTTQFNVIGPIGDHGLKVAEEAVRVKFEHLNLRSIQLISESSIDAAVWVEMA